MYDFFRGPDSTGFAAVRHVNKEVKIAKIASHPLDLFDSKKFIEALKFYDSSVFMGHNRAATKGAVNTVNAHPYEYDHIVGCHNGTLSMPSWRDLEEKIGEQTAVDSMAIIKCIAMFGIEETVPLLQGAWALVWFNKQDNTLNFLRNKERTFWMGFSEDHDKIFWASEWPMMQAATELSPAGYKFALSPENYKYYPTDIDKWYRFDIDRLRSKTDKTHPLEGSVVGEFKGKEAAPVTTYHQGGSPFHTQASTNTTTIGPNKNLPTTPGSTGVSRNQNPDLISLKGRAGDPFAGQLSRDKFEQYAACGCSFCTKPITYDQVGVTIFSKDDIILCPDCSVDPGVNRILTLHVPNVSQMLAAGTHLTVVK